MSALTALGDRLARALGVDGWLARALDARCDAEDQAWAPLIALDLDGAVPGEGALTGLP